MSLLQNYPYHVLIVDDEERDWAEPMRDALSDMAQIVGYNRLIIQVALDANVAREHLAFGHFHLVSLDMRLPERAGEILSVDVGAKLARSFPFLGFPKQLIYSITLGIENIKEKPDEAMTVARIPTDQYAKSTGSDREQEAGVRVLKVKEWAQRVVDSLDADRLHVQETGRAAAHSPTTVVGSYLKHGPELLAPLIARHTQTLANDWETRNTHAQKVNAAIKFIESTIRLALAQSAVLINTEGKPADLPTDERLVSSLNSLEQWLPSLTAWNWSHYLTMEVLAALREGTKTRNNERHKLTAEDSVKAWAELRLPLQYAMDVAAYWVRHPLCVNLRYSRDGWTAEPLAGLSTPRKRRLLPEAQDFPAEAVHDGFCWQHVWRIDGSEPKPLAVNWKDWLVPDSASEKPWWMPMHTNGRGKTVWLDLDSGNTAIR